MAYVGIGHRGGNGGFGHYNDLVQRTLCTISAAEIQYCGASDIDGISIVDRPVGAGQNGAIDSADPK